MTTADSESRQGYSACPHCQGIDARIFTTNHQFRELKSLHQASRPSENRGKGKSTLQTSAVKPGTWKIDGVLVSKAGTLV